MKEKNIISSIFIFRPVIFWVEEINNQAKKEKINFMKQRCFFHGFFYKILKFLKSKLIIKHIQYHQI